MKLLKLFQPSDEELLRSVKVASPCHESWDDMHGGDTVRSCDRCQKKVYNLSEMTAAEAATLVREAEGRICIRFYKRADGTLLTTDCPVGAAAGRAKKVRAAAAFSGAATAAAGLALYHARQAPAEVHATVGYMAPMSMPRDTTPPEPTMGAIAVEPRATMGEVAVDKSFLAQNADQIQLDPRADPFHPQVAPKQPKKVGGRRTAK